MAATPQPPPRLRSAPMRCLALAGLLAAGCSGPSASLDCSGAGEVSGSFRETNSGALIFRHGAAWQEPDGAYSVLLSDDPVLADTARAAAAPEYETALAADMLGALVVGYRFAPDGTYREYITFGSSVSRGWSSTDRGRLDVHDDGCVRGDVSLDDYGAGGFALPLARPEHEAAWPGLDVEIDTRPEPAPADPAHAPPPEDPLAQWTAVHAQLSAADPAHALQALNLSPGAAAVLARDARIRAVLDRIRRQCPDPATARLDEYGDVGGPSEPAPGIVLEGTALTSLADTGPFLRLCYVMARNGESIEQCFPLSEDCSRDAPAPTDH